MANGEHLAIIKRGVKAWNDWRGQNPGIQPDLSGADLRQGTFDLVHFSGANLCGAELTLASLILADLSGADLRRAKFCMANLSWADLREADLARADLSWANLSHAMIQGAKFDSTSLGDTVFGAVDLSKAIGLETCLHEGPSIIDSQTLVRSGPLPLPFLRGCGLPEKLIQSLPFLEQQRKFCSCFISYAHKDGDLARKLYKDLQQVSVPCWIDVKALPIGGDIADETYSIIQKMERVLVILSKHSLNSPRVEDEVKAALAKERSGNGLKVLLPVRIDDSIEGTESLWARRIWENRKVGNLCNWKDPVSYQEAFDLILRNLEIVATDDLSGDNSTDGFEREKAAFHRLEDSLLERYRNRYVAISGGEVVDSHESLWELAKRFRAKFGRSPVYMGWVGDKEKVRIISTPFVSR
ncbi:MAG: TIR domain-containing protein [Nitrospinota bacterium]